MILSIFDGVGDLIMNWVNDRIASIDIILNRNVPWLLQVLNYVNNFINTICDYVKFVCSYLGFDTTVLNLIFLIYGSALSIYVGTFFIKLIVRWWQALAP